MEAPPSRISAESKAQPSLGSLSSLNGLSRIGRKLERADQAPLPGSASITPATHGNFLDVFQWPLYDSEQAKDARASWKNAKDFSAVRGRLEHLVGTEEVDAAMQQKEERRLQRKKHRKRDRTDHHGTASGPSTLLVTNGTNGGGYSHSSKHRRKRVRVQSSESDEEQPSNGKARKRIKLSTIRPNMSLLLNALDPLNPTVITVDPSRYLCPSRGEEANNYIDVEHDYSPTSIIFEDGGVFDEGGYSYQRLKQKDQQQFENFHDAWACITRRDIPRAYKSYTSTRSSVLSNTKRTASLCQKEVRKKYLKNIKSSREIQFKAKKLAREVLLFWRKHDKDEKEAKRKAEKEAEEKRKRDEEVQEAKRQQRKLNFLLTQTELFSHFVGRKQSDQPLDVGPLGESEEEEKRLKEEAYRAAEEAASKQKERTKKFDSQVAHLQPEVTPEYIPSQLAQPSSFKGELKTYQLQGLNWIVNLYEQGINGILADEMGLGKTIQSISVLAHLCEKGIWGPFIVIAPVSTLHNWQRELSRFCPALKVLPYWGNQKERAVIRKYWNPKNLGQQSSPFHVLITSYNLVVLDEKYFHRIKWQYMVLDEAQALKSSASARWKTLLSFDCRNRLLLTGTPIQNSMAELWALLHFIMPTLFDSHDEFNEWFSKDIESHAATHSHLDEHQLIRLHMILKPFMLRRIKKDVEQEIAAKVELEVLCDLSARQKRLYKGIKGKISISELLDKSMTETGMSSLMNLVMQFRKVCNHPEIFERGESRSPFQITEVVPSPQSSYGDASFVVPMYRNPISLAIPKLLQDIEIPTSQKICLWDFSIFTASHISSCLREANSSFAFSRLSDLTPGDIQNIAHSGTLQRALIHHQFIHRMQQLRYFWENKCEQAKYGALLIQERTAGTSCVNVAESSILSTLVKMDPLERMKSEIHLIQLLHFYIPAVWANPIDFYCSNRSFANRQTEILHGVETKRLFLNDGLMPAIEPPIPSASPFPQDIVGLTSFYSALGANRIWLPDVGHLLIDSGKMQTLDSLLTRMKKENHRVLIYSQMTKMLDLLEDFMLFRKYKFVRLDGSSKLEDRRDMVEDFQASNEIFVFLLSTRAGGLGINLTAADTVIFYDSDWNPTMDEQAMDRAHRLGQTKQVTVYRLITKNTIEERILKRAKQKHAIQSLVIDGGKFQAEADTFSAQEVVSLLLDDEEVEQNVQKQLENMDKGKKRSRAGSKPSKVRF